MTPDSHRPPATPAIGDSDRTSAEGPTSNHVGPPLVTNTVSTVAERSELPLAYAEALNRAVGEWLEPFQERLRALGETIRKIKVEWAPAVAALNPVLKAIASIDWNAWWTGQRTAFLAAVKQGWFLQPEMEVGFLSVNESGDLDPDHEQFFIDSIKANLAEIEERLVASYPEREAVLNEGFALHREGRYLASITLFLVCAEGIVLDATNKSAFSLYGSVPEVAQWVRELPLNSLDGLVAEALSVQHPLTSHKGDSRHRIVHGRALDYGNEVASLKAISFLGFAGWVFCPTSGPLAKAAIDAGWERTPRGWARPRTSGGTAKPV